MTEVAAPIRCPVTRKLTYFTETEAQRGLHRVRKDRKGRGTRECAFYLCPHCELYHLTSQRRPKR